MSNLGLWDRWYALVDGKHPEPYGPSTTYELGAAWLGNCGAVEDWGCGKGWFSRYIDPEKYRGVDGSRTPFAEEVVDLAAYRSDVPGIFLRHVLEHDFRWRAILQNALDSYTERMMLVLFTPLGDETRDIEWESDPGVPNISFCLSDITDMIDATGATYRFETMESLSKYGTETVFWISR